MKPDLIKIDTEGTEVRVIEGARQTIEAERPSLLVELNPKSAEASGTSVHEVLSRLCSFGYSFWAFPLKRYGGYRFKPVAYKEGMLGIDGDLVNVACVPAQRVREFQ